APMNTSFAGVGVVTLIELSTMQTGDVQPAHAPVPTVFWLPTVTLPEKYSVPATRSWRPESGTASATFSRRHCGWSAALMVVWSMPLLLYAPIPPVDWPLAQSTQTTSPAFAIVLKPSEPWRQVPMSFMSHHAGIVAACEMMSITNSLPDTCARSASRTNEHTRMFVPAFEAHANVRLFVPVPSPE